MTTVPAALTSRQTEIYRFIQRRYDLTGVGLRVREIGAEFGIRSPQGVICHLDALEKKGWIVRRKGRSGAASIRPAVPGTERLARELTSARADVAEYQRRRDADDRLFRELFAFLDAECKAGWERRLCASRSLTLKERERLAGVSPGPRWNEFLPDEEKF